MEKRGDRIIPKRLRPATVSRRSILEYPAAQKASGKTAVQRHARRKNDAALRGRFAKIKTAAIDEANGIDRERQRATICDLLLLNLYAARDTLCEFATVSTGQARSDGPPIAPLHRGVRLV